MNWKLKSFFWFISLESFIVCVVLFLLPKDSSNAVFIGLSALRLLLILSVFSVGMIFAGITVQQKIAIRAIEKITSTPLLYKLTLSSLILLFIAVFSISYIPSELLHSSYIKAYQRIQPIFNWIWIVSFELCISLVLVKRKIQAVNIKKENKVLAVTCCLGSILIVFFLVLQKTGFGFKPDIVGWGNASPPILSWQIWFSLVIAIASAKIIQKISLRFPKVRYLIYLSPVLIYLSTVIIWMSQPIQVSYFSPRVRPPNYEVYPYSDAGYYSAAAENIVTGNGLLGYSNGSLLSWQVAPRPLFISLLAPLTAVGQGNYSTLIFLQTLFLAFIPVAGYFVGRKIQGDTLGIFIALLSIFKETNTIQATKFISVSHSKLVLADLPTQLVVLGISLLVVNYMISGNKKYILALLTGGSIGAAMLFRTQTVLFLPIILIVDLINIKNWRAWISRAGLIFMGTFLVICPWMIRNLVTTGEFVFDHQIGMISGRYQLDAETQNSPQEDVSSPTNGMGSVVGVILKNPTQVIYFTGEHFINNELTSLMSLAPQPLISTIPYLLGSTKIWSGTGISFTPIETGEICIILLIITCGIIFAYRKLKLAGLIPLILQTVYHLSNSLARNSGGRYTIPVDWVNIVYFAAGLIQIGLWISMLFIPPREVSSKDLNPSPQKAQTAMKNNTLKNVIIAGLVLVGVGCIIPGTEILFSINRISRQDRNISTDNEFINRLAISQDTKGKINASILENGNKVFRGLELYPRFYPSDQGEPGSSWAAYSPLPTCRLGFILLDGEGLLQAIIYLKKPPEFFPSRTRVIVIGSNRSTTTGKSTAEVIQAKYVIIDGENPVVVEGLDEPLLNCRVK